MDFKVLKPDWTIGWMNGYLSGRFMKGTVREYGFTEENNQDFLYAEERFIYIRRHKWRDTVDGEASFTYDYELTEGSTPDTCVRGF